ncbi:IS110 family transposase [uncultured Roseobacter sp.]|uniref:IS110 family transposase n=1 Tax=uncultured Roseobacter sp. TaxID=114847 RepID=UPI003453677C
MRPGAVNVTTPSVEQLEIQAVHRIRQRLVSDRTRLVKQIRGLLAEHGLVVARDISRIRRALSQITDGVDHMLGALLVELVRDVREELNELDQRIAAYTKRIRDLFRSNELCQRIGKIEGIGPITATALIAAVGDRTCFKNGRQFAAWLGLVPKQRSSGGRSRLFGISKRGDRYLRTLLIHGARAVLRKTAGKTDARSLWIERMRDRRHPNVVAVALANKNARIVLAVLSGRTNYQPALSG